MQTESVGAKREKEMLKEISFLEKSKKHMAILQDLQINNQNIN